MNAGGTLFPDDLAASPALQKNGRRLAMAP